MKTILLRSAALSDPGRLRANNEDRVYSDDEHGIYMVIDGVGGEAAGERAAAIAEEELVARLRRSAGTIEDRIREGIALAAKRIHEHARQHSELTGMACVLTVAVIADGEVVIGHVGDTRLYKIRHGAIEKLTRDHSPVGAREDAGEISESEAMHHPRRNEIFRDVGSEEHAPYDPDFIDILRVRFEPDSALLLCSDGLSDQVSSAGMLDAVERHAGDPARVTRELIRLANEAGGKDNVSAVYLEGPAFANAPEAAGHEAPQPQPARKTPAVLPIVLGVLAGIALGAAGVVVAYRVRTSSGPPDTRILTVSPSAQDAYTTISEALSEARAGDTVEVLPGTYREQVEMKDGVRLIARPYGEAVLEARANAVQAGAAIVAQRVLSGMLSGFKIVLPGASGVSVGILVSDSDVEIDGVDIAGAKSAAVLVRGTARPLIRGSHIHDNGGAGIVVQDEAAPRLISNLIARNGNQPDAHRSGLEVMGKAQPIVLASVFANNYRNVSWDKSPEREAQILKQNVVVGSAPAKPRPPAHARGNQ